MTKIKYTKDILEPIVAKSKSYAEVIRSFKLKPSGGTYTNFRKIIRDYDLDVSHFTGQGWAKGLTSSSNESIRRVRDKISFSDSEILCEFSPPSIRSSRIKTLMLKNGSKYRCHEESCDIIDEWNGKKLTLHIDHINGITSDNRLSNLRFLCPNCHQQTPTWGRKKRG